MHRLQVQCCYTVHTVRAYAWSLKTLMSHHDEPLPTAFLQRSYAVRWPYRVCCVTEHLLPRRCDTQLARLTWQAHRGYNPQRDTPCNMQCNASWRRVYAHRRKMERRGRLRHINEDRGVPHACERVLRAAALVKQSCARAPPSTVLWLRLWIGHSAVDSSATDRCIAVKVNRSVRCTHCRRITPRAHTHMPWSLPKAYLVASVQPHTSDAAR
jgi:hypothetical protein